MPQVVIRNRRPAVDQPPFDPISDGLLPLATTTTGNVTLPATLGGTVLTPGQSVTKTYGFLFAADLTSLLDLVRTGQINFPGSTNIPKGLPTDERVYCLNNEEPDNPEEGDEVFSLADDKLRKWNGQKWITEGFDSWETIAFPQAMRRVGAWTAVLPTGEILIVGGGDDTLGGIVLTATIPAGKTNAGQLGAFCQRFDPIAKTLTNSCPLPSNNVGFTLGVRANPLVSILPSGKVLAGAGANFAIGVPNFFEDPAATFKDFWIYDPTTDDWTAAADSPETQFVTIPPILLRDGRVLSAGQTSPSTTTWPSGGAATQLEKFRFPMSLNTWSYNYLTNTWATHGDLNFRRVFGRMTLLDNGKVFMAGGSGDFQARGITPIKCEVFDPVANTWSLTPDMPGIEQEDKMSPATIGGLAIASITRTTGGTPISGMSGPHMNVRVNAHAGTQYYPGGTITVAGATNALNNGVFPIILLVNDTPGGFARIYYYNEAGVNQAGAAGTASVTEIVPGMRYQPFVAAIPGNRAIVAGGNRPPNNYDCRTAACSQSGGTFTNLVVNSESMRKSTVIYDATSNTWVRVGDMYLARNSCTGGRLKNGNLLVINGRTFNQGSIAACEVFDHGSLTWVDADLLDPVVDVNGDFVLFQGNTGNPPSGASPSPGFVQSGQMSAYRYLLWRPDSVDYGLLVALFGAVDSESLIVSSHVSIYREGVPSLGHHLRYIS